MSTNARSDREKKCAAHGDDIRPAPVAAFAAFVACLVVACFVIGIAFLRLAIRSQEDSDTLYAAPNSAPPASAPRLQVDPRAELDALQRDKQAALYTSDFVDRSAGIVRIPIALAIDLAVERGLKQFAAQAATASKKEDR